MAKDKTQGLSTQEIEKQSTEDVGEREEMSLLNANLVAPVNAAVAANVLSDNSVAYANAEQDVDVDQSN